MKKLSSKKFESADKLWKVLEIALEDLKYVEKQEEYVVDMDNQWLEKTYDSNGNKICRVCLAGCVMARRFAMPDTFYPSEYDFDDNTVINKLFSLNELRMGDIALAVAKFYDNKIDVKYTRNYGVPIYDYDKNKFHKEMENILEFLKLEDL